MLYTVFQLNLVPKGFFSSCLSRELKKQRRLRLRKRHLKSEFARERQASGEGVAAREADENRSYSLSESAENSYWLRGSRGDKRSR